MEIIFSNNDLWPPPPRSPSNVALFHHLYDFLCLWHRYSKTFPKSDRHTIGQKVFSELLDLLTAIMKAEYLPKETKKTVLRQAAPALDRVKILIRLCLSCEIIPEWDYATLETQLQDIGKQLGGWIRSLP